jgi:uncharacterized OB-fold protein
VSRPLPASSALTEPFWEAARGHVLVRPLCNACGSSFFSPQIACPRCLSENWAYRESSGRGVVYSAVVVHRAPLEGFEVPYHLAIVDLEEDWSMLSNILVAATDPVPIGTPVSVTWIHLDGDCVLPAFVPDSLAQR